MSVLGALSAPRREVRTGLVVSVAGSVVTVDVGLGASVDAQVPTVPAFTLTAGQTVFLLPVQDTWLVIARL